MMIPSAEPTRDPDLAAAQAHAIAVVRRSGTSFYYGMRILPPERRMAMYALYAFGREVDDVADDHGPRDEKLRQLDAWRGEVERLYAGGPVTFPTVKALVAPVARFGLPKEEFLSLVDGMEMDARDAIHGPDWETLRLYCRRVAGTVGLLSIRVFGADEAEAPEFALALADGLQLTNILRDLGEDAERGRLYLPRELLDEHRVPLGGDLFATLRHPHMPAVCDAVATEARRRFADTDRALAACRRDRLRPALLMMGVYEQVLDQLTARPWRPAGPPLKLGSLQKLRAAILQGPLRPKWRPAR